MPISPNPTTRERRSNLELRAAIDEMLERIRDYRRLTGAWTPEERAQAERELEAIMTRIRDHDYAARIAAVVGPVRSVDRLPGRVMTRPYALRELSMKPRTKFLIGGVLILGAAAYLMASADQEHGRLLPDPARAGRQGRGRSALCRHRRQSRRAGRSGLDQS